MVSDHKTTKKTFSRRKFLQRGAIVMGGTVVASYMSCSPLRRFAAQKAESMDLPADLSSLKPDFWFQVLADNTILLKVPKSEMGQGIFTGFAMMAAEELEISLAQIKVESASTSSGITDSFGTGGSSSTISLYKPIREVAATMREMLKMAAAKQWGVKTETITAQHGTLTSGNHTAKYADIATATKAWEVPKTPDLKPASAFKYIGKEQKRADVASKVMANAKFTIDMELPEMLHALTLESPYFEGKIKSIDTSKAATSANVVKVVHDGELVAVVAKTRYAAEVAIKKIAVTWDVPQSWQQTDIEAMVTVGKTKAVNIQKEGKADDIINDNDKSVLKQEYRTPIATHAPMEVFGAIADVKSDKITIIIGTQMPVYIRDQVAKDLGVDKDKVDVQVPYLGGGFGRKTARNYASKAAILSKMIGKPVKLMPTREQEFQNSLYRPNTHHVLRAKMADNGTVEAIIHDQATPDMMIKSIAGSTALKLLGADWVSAGHGASILYNIKNRTTNIWNIEVPYPAGIWRTVGVYPNTFAIESFIDEVAIQTKKDPLVLRLELLKGGDEISERMAKTLMILQEKSGWNNPKTDGVGRGIAICSDRKTIAAAAIEVVVIDNKIKVKKVTNVLDVGFAINPEGIRAQVESCVMMGIGAGLYEEIQIKDGQINATNYHQYPMATLSDTPDIQIVILENASDPYGVGEPPIAPIAPAIANAIFDLTGKRLRNLPLQRSLEEYV
jgi:isoquinoline 1-oxidoreductase subunit beta